jgi:spore maturation protein CgeB
MNNTGVTLILHDADHFLGRTPTARIFEAAAASTIIITDRNPFIEKNFRDAVLYIDQEKSAEELFQQIDSHMKWIKDNPEKALLLAKKAHEIFIQKYTLEAQLEKLVNLHKTLFVSNATDKKESI